MKRGVSGLYDVNIWLNPVCPKYRRGNVRSRISGCGMELLLVTSISHILKIRNRIHQRTSTSQGDCSGPSIFFFFAFPCFFLFSTCYAVMVCPAPWDYVREEWGHSLSRFCPGNPLFTRGRSRTQLTWSRVISRIFAPEK